eukprot:Nitzschia sp. Nitz4//scaffold59_size112058//75955//76824//NITZ4_004118-RA/size112058-processed-gene-0.197-mRNA-1//1//CDS//3329555150//5506//frame0
MSPSPENILLDSNIRDWVVLPLFVIMVAAGLLRVYVGNMLKPDPKDVTKVTQRTQGTIRATSALKSGSVHFLSSSKLEARKASYPEVITRQAEWCEDHLDANEATASGEAASPFAGMEAMQGNMVFMVQNMVMMQAIQHFFSGFILLKVPFHLTMGFKEMFQRGLQGLSTLDTSYVSSVSWYFLVMFGLRGFFRLAMGTPLMETMESQQLSMLLGKRGGGGNPAQVPDDEKMIQGLHGEVENLPLALPKQFKSQLDSVEKRLLQNKYPKKKGVVSGSDFLLHQTAKKNK